MIFYMLRLWITLSRTVAAACVPLQKSWQSLPASCTRSSSGLGPCACEVQQIGDVSTSHTEKAPDSPCAELSRCTVSSATAQLTCRCCETNRIFLIRRLTSVVVLPSAVQGSSGSIRSWPGKHYSRRQFNESKTSSSTSCCIDTTCHAFGGITKPAARTAVCFEGILPSFSRATASRFAMCSRLAMLVQFCVQRHDTHVCTTMFRS